MKYKISRVTDTKGESPCKNAKAEVVQKIYFASKEDAKNGIKSEKDVVEWYVELDSLEDLMDLTKEVGEIIVFADNEIVIYDDYIE